MRISQPAKLLSGCFGVFVAMGFLWCLTVCWVIGGNPFHLNPFDTLRFNQHDWLEDRSCEDGSNRRGHMANDIIRHHLRPGMAETQVVALLGAPDHVYTRAEVRHHLNAYKRGYEPEHIFSRATCRPLRWTIITWGKN